MSGMLQLNIPQNTHVHMCTLTHERTHTHTHTHTHTQTKGLFGPNVNGAKVEILSPGLCTDLVWQDC